MCVCLCVWGGGVSEGGGGILQEGMFQQSKQCEASCRKHFKAKEETRITHTHKESEHIKGM